MEQGRQSPGPVAKSGYKLKFQLVERRYLMNFSHNLLQNFNGVPCSIEAPEAITLNAINMVLFLIASYFWKIWEIKKLGPAKLNTRTITAFTLAAIHIMPWFI